MGGASIREALRDGVVFAPPPPLSILSLEDGVGKSCGVYIRVFRNLHTRFLEGCLDLVPRPLHDGGGELGRVGFGGSVGGAMIGQHEGRRAAAVCLHDLPPASHLCMIYGGQKGA